MNCITMKEQKIVLVIGIICTGFFCLFAFIAFAAEGLLPALLFIPLALLGVYLILVYLRHFIQMEADQMILSEPFKKPQIIRYSQIGMILLHTTNIGAEIILLDRQKNRITKFEMNMKNSEKGADILFSLDIPFIDLAGMIACGNGIDEYLPVLNRFERFIYRPQIHAVENARKIEAASNEKKLERQKQFVKVMGWVFLALDLAAFLLNGKWTAGCLVLVLFFAWGLYIAVYPNLYFEVAKSVQFRKYIIQMPFFGIAAAALFCLLFFGIFNYQSGDYLIFTGIFAVLLLLPLTVKLWLLKEKPDKWRFLLNCLAALALAFVTTMPVNYLATFHGDGHETVIVNDKDISTGRHLHYYVYADWQEPGQEFSVSRTSYQKIRIGDRLQVCMRHSIFGFHYWTVHK